MQPRRLANADDKSLVLEFDDNRYALELFGSHHSHLARIEHAFDVSVDARGNRVTIAGAGESVDLARTVLDHLYGRLRRGQTVLSEDVDAAVRMAAATGDTSGANVEVRVRQRTVSPRTATQAAYIKSIDDFDLVFGLGPAGTGKTYLAVAKAVERLVSGGVDRIILSRPAVEAGEQLGFLPGSMREKVDPYLRPLYDALYDMLPAQQVVKRLESGEIEVAPLAFMRGRTLANAFVILDEAQNTTSVQMKMFLTRLGQNARMVVTGDLSQVDLPKGTRSGLRHALEVLHNVDDVAFVHFTDADVVRHPLVTRIVRAYEEAESRLGVGARYAAGPARGNERNC
ncbi:MAG: PhoH family protein [Rhodospirillales bacterium]|nr:PhoH family protein [Rhodospirillales bacterium]